MKEIKTTVKLKGITWNHSRGLVPMVASSQRYSELNPGIEITWDVRSLQEFAGQSLDELVDDYDLLILDHPWVGYVEQTGILIPLDSYLSEEFLENQSANSVGASYSSYEFGEHLWALPVDAAAPVASSRPDLLQKMGLSVPETMKDLLSLADRGWVAFPSISIDALMNFNMLCSAFGEDPFQSKRQVVRSRVGIEALQLLRKLTLKVDPACLERNPIKIYEAMTQSDDIAYCPFAYGYINFARKNYARKRLQFHDLVAMDDSVPLKSTLGGTGLGISANSSYIEEACSYAEYVASAGCQQSIYTESGGQPAHKSAWTSKYANDLCGDFLSNTLSTLERAYMRPRYNGYLYFQDHAGALIREYIIQGGKEETILQKLDQLYRGSLVQ